METWFAAQRSAANSVCRRGQCLSLLYFPELIDADVRTVSAELVLHPFGEHSCVDRVHRLYVYPLC